MSTPQHQEKLIYERRPIAAGRCDPGAPRAPYAAARAGLGATSSRRLIRRYGPGSASTPTSSASDLHAVRQIVEVAAARAAVLHISAHQVAVMRHTLREIETESANGSSGAWFRFIELHRQIVEASGNSVLVTIYSLIEHLLNRHQVPFLPSIANWQHELASHGRLIDLLETRDADAVEAEMTHHLALADQLRQDLLQHAHARPAPPRT